MKAAEERSSILVWRTGHLGDTICAVPAFRLIRRFFPHAELVLLCDQPGDGSVAATEVVGRFGIFDRIITYSSRRRARTAWDLYCVVRRELPESVILLSGVRETTEGVHRKSRFLKICGARRVHASYFPESRTSWRGNEPARLIELLHRYGIDGEKPGYDVPSDFDARSTILKKLATAGLDAGKPFVVFCGGGKAPTQRWPLERYAAVLAALPWPVVGIGGTLDVSAYREKVAPICAGLRLLPDPLSLAEVFELLRTAGAYFGNDTGPMHVAAAVGCPVAAIISGRNAPGMWDPDVEPSLIFRHRTDCEDCFLQECIEERHRCMTEITATRVTTDLLPLLTNPSQADGLCFRAARQGLK